MKEDCGAIPCLVSPLIVAFKEQVECLLLFVLAYFAGYTPPLKKGSQKRVLFWPFFVGSYPLKLVPKVLMPKLAP